MRCPGQPQGGIDHHTNSQDPLDSRRPGQQQGWSGVWRNPEVTSPSRGAKASLRLLPCPSPARRGLTTERSLMAAAPPPRAGSNNGKQIAELGNVSSTLAFQDTRLLMKTQLCRHHLNDRPNFKGLQTISFAAPPPQ